MHESPMLSTAVCGGMNGELVVRPVAYGVMLPMLRVGAKDVARGIQWMLRRGAWTRWFEGMRGFAANRYCANR